MTLPRRHALGARLVTLAAALLFAVGVVGWRRPLTAYVLLGVAGLVAIVGGANLYADPVRRRTPAPRTPSPWRTPTPPDYFRDAPTSHTRTIRGKR